MKTTIKLFLITFLVTLSSCNSINDQDDITEVAVVFPVTIDSFEKLKDGLHSELGKTLKLSYYSAEGDIDKFETVVQSALLTKPKYLVTIGTQITNTAFGPKFKNRLNNVIAGSISSPELVESLIKVGLSPPRSSPVAIISDSPKEDIYVELVEQMLLLVPETKKVGIIFNRGEINSLGTATKTKNALEASKIEVSEGLINAIGDVENITKKLLRQKIDILIIPHDKNAVSKAASIVKLANEKGIPVFSLDDGTIKDGVSVGISVNYNQIGRNIGKSILQIEDGTKQAYQMPIVYEDKAFVYINSNRLRSLGLKFPEKRTNHIEY